MADDKLDDTLLENAQGPAKMSGDGWSAEQHPIPDVIALDKHRAAKAAMSNPALSLVRMKIIPPGGA